MSTEQPDKGSAIDKFRDGESLLKAYKALEAEFTRKSQQLAALQRENEENAAWNAALQGFCERYPDAREQMDKIAGAAEEKSRQGLSDAYIRVLESKRVSPDELLADEQFRFAAARDEGVRRCVITDYLTALAGGSSPGFALGGCAPASPRREAGSLDEAGRMAQGLFNQKGI